MTIRGTNFVGVSSVKLGTVSAPFDVITSKVLRANVPAVQGSLHWQVTTPGGTATSAGIFRAAG